MPRNRIADLRLRGNTSPLPVRVYWPGQPVTRPVPLLVFCSVGPGAGSGTEADRGTEADDGTEADRGTEAACRSLSQDAGVMVLSVCCAAGAQDGTTVLEWAAEHAAELGADPGRLLVAGEGEGAVVAAAVASAALAAGWPPVTLLTDDLRRSLPAWSDEFQGQASSALMNKSTEEK